MEGKWDGEWRSRVMGSVSSETLTFWTKGNSGSCYFTSVFCERVWYFTGRAGSLSWCTHIEHSMAPSTTIILPTSSATYCRRELRAGGLGLRAGGRGAAVACGAGPSTVAGVRLSAAPLIGRM
ncbi:hypothetical protein EVAR_70360_1 [Eumeta japonica]|uniref:Uncharacterized protein n=1 Tax=Eumeta variegata TaxID=151549 RepID=A0A4C2A2J3_EUMVA|nr:hypothetical protein EVAR_70360_1 [Eumeta japonica]